MILPPGITTLPIEEWTNAHENFTQILTKGASYDISLSGHEFETLFPTFKAKYDQTTKNFQWLIKNAIDKNQRIRALGSGWSISKAGVCEGGLVNTKKLRLKAKLEETMVAEDYLLKGGKAENLVFVQCGNTIISINEWLERKSNPAKSIRISGGSNGQTIAGAFSTGTHGAAFRTGALPDMVMGMHVVTGPDTHYWIEKSTSPVTSAKFRLWLGAPVILDDDTFNAILVSFGSFGFIHGVLLEVESKFLLEQELKRVPYNEALEKAIVDYDFTSLGNVLKYSGQQFDESIYHFELAINPHDFEKGNPDKGAYLRVMYKQPYTDNYTAIDPYSKGYTYGDDTLGLIQLVLDALPGNKIELALIPSLVNRLFNTAFDRPETAKGTIGETFKNTIFRGKLFSGAISIDKKDVPYLIDLVLKINKTIPFAGVMAMRFVKGNAATFSFTKFQHTCVIELDGVDAQVNHDFLKELIQQIENDGIAYAVHWGKTNDFLNSERIKKIYGEEKINAWLMQRKKLMGHESMAVFTNGFLERLGLDKIIAEDDILV